MPIYEYQCQACGERHDALQKFSEGALRKCPACGKLKLKKLVSAAAFHLKGTGWYATDFRDKGKTKDKDKGDGEGSTAVSAAKPTETAAETKTDAKVETKPESKTKDTAKSKSSKSA